LGSGAKLRILVPIMMAWPPAGRKAILTVMPDTRPSDEPVFNRLAPSRHFDN
jgi:hypothetical protein